MKKLMLSTALILTTGFAAQAQDASATFRSAANPGEIHASNFIGMRVYASEASLDADAYNGVQTDWEDIGEINDVILSREGEVEAVLVDIGGFLGIGERQVAVDMDALKFVADDDTPEDLDDYFLVINADRATFEEAPEYEYDQAMAPAMNEAGEDVEQAANDAGEAIEETGEDVAQAADEAATDLTEEAQDMAQATEEEMTSPLEGYTQATGEEVTAEMLEGAPVYDANDEWIGEVSQIILTDGGMVDATVIDVGGFLGIGEKPVAVAMGDLAILREDGGDDLRIHVALTEEQLEAMPTFEK